MLEPLRLRNGFAPPLYASPTSYADNWAARVLFWAAPESMP
jgi:hypothetical protein